MCYYVQNNHFCTSGDNCGGHYLLASINCQIVSREKMEIVTVAVNKSLFDYAEAACQSFLIHLGSSCCISPHSTGEGDGQMIWCRGGGWRRRRRTCRYVCEVEWADIVDSLSPSPHAGGFSPSEEHCTPKVPADNRSRSRRKCVNALPLICFHAFSQMCLSHKCFTFQNQLCS